MYIPNSLKMEPANSVDQFIQEYGFGVLVSETLQATHLPFLYDSTIGEFGILHSHMARANPHWKSLDGKDVMIIFSGPHSYISPTWYASGPAVPTWNYVAVHVYGKLNILSDEETLQVVNDTVKKYEPELLNNASVMPQAYREKLLKAIVSFKVSLTGVEAKHKLGQQRNSEDQFGVFSALQASSNLESVALANYMNRHNVGIVNNAE